MNLQELSQKLEDHLTDQDIQDAQELLDDTYQEIVDMRGELVEAQAEIERLRAKVERLKVGNDRYEILRKLNVVQFQALYTKALQSHLPFDELVDVLGESK